MPSASIHGISTRYAVTGQGPTLLMYSPGGFDARLENWTDFSIYARLNLLAHLSRRYRCITFDRREAGRSGGRIEAVGWNDYVAQGSGLLDHLEIDAAYLMGGCIGCSSVAAFAVAHPARTLGMVLFSPAGGPRYRMSQPARFADHAAFVRAHDLPGVVELARSSGQTFSQDARQGPWVTVIRSDPDFAARYSDFDREQYLGILAVMARRLFDRDTVPGAEPEELMRLDVPALIVPGQDKSHAPSAARYLQECLPNAQFWDVPVDEQTNENAPKRVLDFLGSAG
jgi:pimeloyl-ACP methyl ester carboxylesterase